LNTGVYTKYSIDSNIHLLNRAPSVSY